MGIPAWARHSLVSLAIKPECYLMSSLLELESRLKWVGNAKGLWCVRVMSQNYWWPRWRTDIMKIASATIEIRLRSCLVKILKARKMYILNKLPSHVLIRLSSEPKLWGMPSTHQINGFNSLPCAAKICNFIFSVLLYMVTVKIFATFCLLFENNFH